MDAARLIRTARRRARLTLRELADLAGTSHSTISAYEQGRTTPNVDTLDRLLRAAGFAVDVELSPRMGRLGPDRGQELMEVLELAGMFPARHTAQLEFPRFGVVA